MARQILDLRTQAQRQGITGLQQSMKAISGILQTLREAEKVRRERQTLDRITRAIGAGATDIEAIAAAAGQGPEFGTGFQGILQKLGGAFQPQGGGIGQGIQQMIIGEKLKQALAPKAPKIPSGLETTGVTVGPKGGVTQRFAPKVAKASLPQVAKPGDGTGLPEGTVYQTGPQGNIRILDEPKEPELLTDKERRELELFGKRERPGEEKRTKATVLLEQIDNKIADGSVVEGSPEHLRLLGVSSDKIEMPEDKLKFWQTVLQKTIDSLGTTLEGQEDTARLAADKIEEAKKEIRGGITPEAKTLDVPTATAILRETRGDVEKARELARQRGFKF